MLQSMRSAARYIWWFVAAMFLIGFVFYQQSGLSDRTITAGSTVAKVNGTSITYENWSRALRERIQEAQQRSGKTPDADEDKVLENQLFDELVADVLLQQEYEKRGITVSDAEIQQAAMEQPYPPIARNPEFQTEGRFDFQKYQRFLASPAAKQQGVLAMLEVYYREALLKSKLYEQIATTVYATDAQLWRLWRDTRDSVKVTYVALGADAVPDSAVHVSDSAVKAYYDAHAKLFTDIPGKAVVTIARLPRAVSAADSQRARAKAEALRLEIMKGAKFEDVAKRESADTGSAANGGALGTAARGSFVPAFETAAYALPVGQISQPVLSPFGYHLIRVDARKGDSITTHHILIRIQQSDSAATATDRRADQLAKAAGSPSPRALDSVAKTLGLETAHVDVTEGNPANLKGRSVPGASAWAFDGAKPGEIGELIDADDAYYLVRLDSLTPSTKPSLEGLKDQIRQLLAREKKLDQLMPKAQQLAAAAAAQGFEKGAKSLGYFTMASPSFSRTGPSTGLGMGTEAVGVAFGLPVGTVSAPARSRTALVIERVDTRTPADSLAWEKQKPLQRSQVEQRIREQMVQQYVQNLRQNATIVDNRKAIQAASRQTATTS